MDELDGRDFIKSFGGRSLKNAVERISHRYFEIPLDQLEYYASPTQTDQDLKFFFWNLALSAHFRSKKVKISEIYANTCSYTWFWNGILKNEAKLAWILRQPYTRPYEIELTIHLHLNAMRKALVAYDNIPAKDWPPSYHRFLLDGFRKLSPFFR